MYNGYTAQAVINGTVSLSRRNLPSVPGWMSYISKTNDVFSATAHSIIVAKYLFNNLDFINAMRLDGANPSKALSYLPQASWLEKLGTVVSLFDVGLTIYDNLQQGNSLSESLLDGGLSFLKGQLAVKIGGFVGGNVSGLVGAWFGNLIPVPVVGTFIGFAVGTGVGIVVSWFIDDILGLIKDGLLDWMFD